MAMSSEDNLKKTFPKLRNQEWKKTSEHTNDYNCLAWAAGETHRRWDLNPNDYWPDEALREQTIPAFIEAYETRGYAECDNGDFEHGYEKIVIYAINGRPQHAARQLENGSWTSKLGGFWDIEHSTADGVESKMYGDIQVFMKRPITTSGDSKDEKETM